MSIDYERIHRNGWRQGSVFRVKDSFKIIEAYAHTPQLMAYNPPPRTRLIVTSHSCDVVAKHDMEMACEVCPAQPLSANIGLEMFGGGRHPRQLRLQIDFDGRLTLYEMFAPRRFAIERGYLESYVPDNRAIVPDSEVAGFELWLGSRYRRRALPNAFDLRLGKGHTKIRKALVPVHEHVQQLLYSIQPLSELNDPDRVYELKIVILARSSSWQNLETVSALEEAKSRIEEILDECNGIQAEVELASDSKFTYDKLHTYSQWGFEDLSAD